MPVLPEAVLKVLRVEAKTWAGWRGALVGMAGSFNLVNEPYSGRQTQGAKVMGDPVWCCMLASTNKTDGFLLRARRKPQQ
ncbi:hypothetical protein LP417_25915 [Polaromonas sp. P1-6]|nr:hypothetical protein LP417_25915 [Polaromonas sp. P1-6]